MVAIFQMTFSSAFSLMKMYEFRFKFHWSLFLSFKVTASQNWFKLWLGGVQATSHCLNQWWYNLLTHICVTQPQWVKTTSITITIGSLHLMLALKLQTRHETQNHFLCALIVMMSEGMKIYPAWYNMNSYMPCCSRYVYNIKDVSCTKTIREWINSLALGKFEWKFE